MFDLFQSLTGSLKITIRCVLSLFDEPVQDNDLTSDHRAVESSANAFLAPAAQFKQAVAHGAGVRQAQVSTMLFLTGSLTARRLERVKGIEPSYAAWEAAVLPLNYTRTGD